MVVLFALVLPAACSDTATVESADAFDVAETADTDLPTDATAATDAAIDTSEPTDTTVDPCPGGAGCPCGNDFDCDDGDPCTWARRAWTASAPRVFKSPATMATAARPTRA
jgi:hypothetical protein